MDLKNSKIAVIGLGYVGLPLAVEFGKKRPTIGFDINRSRVEALKEGVDHTLEITAEDLLAANHLELTNDLAPVGEANVFIITVPTPVDKSNNPDLGPVLKASEMVAGLLKKGDVVIYESTVYPGCTEEECVPVLERISGMVFNEDFYCGYSPERINPGDKTHTLTTIKKVTSGSTPEVGKAIDELYGSIITAGTHLAPSIKVAEAAKVIENAQRDINIAFVNELAKIFNRIGIDTNEVLEASATKWNFLPFKPGLVGGHCIGVDPYYLAQKAQQVGYHPEIILAGRRLNDGMGAYVVEEVVKLMVRKSIQVVNARCLVLGFTFKENCPDVRNTRVIDIINELKSYHIEPVVYDPWANIDEVKHEYNCDILNALPEGKFEAVILAVAHNEFRDINIRSLTENGVVYDVKGVIGKEMVDGRL